MATVVDLSILRKRQALCNNSKEMKVLFIKLRETEEMKRKPRSPSCSPTKAVCLPAMNYEARGGWKVSLSLAKDGRSCSSAQSTIYFYGNRNFQALLAEQTMEEMYSCFLAKQLLHLFCPRKRKLQNFKWARIPESSNIFTAIELGDLKTTAHSTEKWDFYKYVYQQMNI